MWMAANMLTLKWGSHSRIDGQINFSLFSRHIVQLLKCLWIFCSAIYFPFLTLGFRFSWGIKLSTRPPQRLTPKRLTDVFSFWTENKFIHHDFPHPVVSLPRSLCWRLWRITPPAALTRTCQVQPIIIPLGGCGFFVGCWFSTCSIRCSHWLTFHLKSNQWKKIQTFYLFSTSKISTLQYSQVMNLNDACTPAHPHMGVVINLGCSVMIFQLFLQ